MPVGDLRAFIARLDGLGELHRVTVETDSRLEIAAVTDRVGRMVEDGPALLFEQVKGSRFAVATNLFGSARRMALALGVDNLNQLGERMERFLAAVGREGGLPLAPRPGSEALCRDVVDDPPDLSTYPILQNWPGDGQPIHDGRFLTLPVVVTRDPQTGRVNCGMYRLAVLGPNRLGLHWGAGSGAAAHFRGWQERGEPMPVAVALGGDPAVTFVASVPLPDDLDELELAGFLRGEPVQVVTCRHANLPVPATAELVIEGFVDPDETATEGAFGNHTGFYDVGDQVPVLRVTGITRREGMIYPATVVGQPPMEDCWLARAAERLLLPLLRRELPELADIHLPFAGIFHGCALVAIDKRDPWQARRVMERLWSRGLLRNSRFLVILDASDDLRDLAGAAWRVVNRVDWQRDLVVAPWPGAGGALPFGSRLGIDATRKLPQERDGRPWPKEIRPDEAVAALVVRRWREYGFTE